MMSGLPFSGEDIIVGGVASEWDGRCSRRELKGTAPPGFGKRILSLRSIAYGRMDEHDFSLAKMSYRWKGGRVGPVVVVYASNCGS